MWWNTLRALAVERRAARPRRHRPGPLLFRYSISATGFSLGSARAGDSQHFASVFRTANLFGALRGNDRGLGFAAGGPLGNAIMLAMLSAPRSSQP
ncbi:MAG TPA: hypothetical protein VJV78_23670 [Polyangiales bacterium]|nr:hypothetical protein [Polyangiales bacterium]